MISYDSPLRDLGLAGGRTRDEAAVEEAEDRVADLLELLIIVTIMIVTITIIVIINTITITITIIIIIIIILLHHGAVLLGVLRLLLVALGLLLFCARCWTPEIHRDLFRAPLFRGSLIISLHVLVQYYLADCLYK